MAKIKVKIGDAFDRLTVISITRRDKVTFCKCRCVCGNEKTFRYGNLQTGNTFSCGCLKKEQLAIRSRKPKGVAAINQIWNYYLRNARTRNIVWELSKDEFKDLIFQPCHYCGIKPCTITKTDYNDQVINNGIDRFNNNMGYTSKNSVPCCKMCNLAKNNLSYDVFKEWAQRLANHLYGYVVH